MDINQQQVCRFLRDADHVTIISHMKPDGDTLGAAFALLQALRALGKSARVVCGDGFPRRYEIITGCYETPSPFREDTVVAVDLADPRLMGGLEAAYQGRVDLCIDHHTSNTHYAHSLYLDGQASSTCEMMLGVILGMGVALTPAMATALYGGISTDTGCFQFSSTKASTHRAAALLIDAGANHEEVNRLMFESDSRERLAVEIEAKRSISYYYEGRCAVMSITPAMLRGTAITDYDLEGFSAIPRKIEGVEVGVTIRELEDGICRVSLRSCLEVNVSRVCQTLGGGGHVHAAGCTIRGSLASVAGLVLDALAPYFTGLERNASCIRE